MSAYVSYGDEGQVKMRENPYDVSSEDKWVVVVSRQTVA